MGNGTEFWQTMMGRKFYESDVPKAVQALGVIGAALTELVSMEKAVAPETLLRAEVEKLIAELEDEDHSPRGLDIARELRGLLTVGKAAP